MDQLSEDLFSEMRKSELFNQADESAWQMICAKSELVDLEKGQILFYQDDPADAMYVVLSGLLEVTMADESGRKAVIGKVDPFMPVYRYQRKTSGGQGRGESQQNKSGHHRPR